MYVRCDESSLYSRINYVHSPDGELLCGSVRSVKRYTEFGIPCCIMPTPGADTEETGRYDLAWKDLCSRSEYSQVNIDYQKL